MQKHFYTLVIMMNGPRKNRVLWLSRHGPVFAQMQFLMKKIDNCEIIIHKGPVSTAAEAVMLVKKYRASYVLPVLPMTFIFRLVEESKKNGFTVLYSEMKKLHECGGENCPEYNMDTDTVVKTRNFKTGNVFYRHFRFVEIKRIKEIKLETEPL